MHSNIDSIYEQCMSQFVCHRQFVCHQQFVCHRYHNKCSQPFARPEQFEHSIKQRNLQSELHNEILKRNLVKWL